MDPFSNIAWLLTGSEWVPNQGGEMSHRPLHEAIPVFSVDRVWQVSTDSRRFLSLSFGHVSFVKPEAALQNDARTQVAASISSMTGQTDGVICVVLRNHFWLRKALRSPKRNFWKNDVSLETYHSIHQYVTECRFWLMYASGSKIKLSN